MAFHLCVRQNSVARWPQEILIETIFRVLNAEREHKENVENGAH